MELDPLWTHDGFAHLVLKGVINVVCYILFLTICIYFESCRKKFLAILYTKFDY